MMIETYEYMCPRCDSIKSSYVDLGKVLVDVYCPSCQCFSRARQWKHLLTSSAPAPHNIPKGSPITVEVSCNESAINPTHYKDQYPIEVKEMIQGVFERIYGEEWDRYFEAYCLGNELKYRLRAGFKNKDKIQEDIEKALWYNQERRGESIRDLI